ncbi:MAG: aconitase X [Pseudomonadota bacterium]
MELTPEQQQILGGGQGPEMAQCMATLVRMGEAFNAARLVPIKSAHLTGSFKIASFKGYYELLQRIVSAGLRVAVPTTLNPHPGYEYAPQNRVLFRGQKMHEAYLEALGVTPNYSCVCYAYHNIPEFGDVVAWAESSAVIYANSVIGARTNRHALLADICQAILGLTPEFGFLLDENRRGRVRVKLDIETMDAPALGFLLGQHCMDRTPVIDHHPFNQAELKNMGGAMAASGGVAMFHVIGLTPEAPDEASALQQQEPEQTITITQADLDALRADHGVQKQTAMVAIGCPQMTLEEVTEVAQHFVGKQVRKKTMLHVMPDAMRAFQETPLFDEVLKSGAELYEHCPLSGLSLRIGIGKQPVLTPSGKLHYYLEGTQYGDLQDVLKVCGVLND